MLVVTGKVSGPQYDGDGSGSVHVSIEKEREIPEAQRAPKGPATQLVAVGHVSMRLPDEDAQELMQLRKKRVRVTFEVIED